MADTCPFPKHVPAESLTGSAAQRKEALLHSWQAPSSNLTHVCSKAEVPQQFVGIASGEVHLHVLLLGVIYIALHSFSVVLHLQCIAYDDSRSRWPKCAKPRKQT